jgi:hypothetical protein
MPRLLEFIVFTLTLLSRPDVLAKLELVCRQFGLYCELYVGVGSNPPLYSDSDEPFFLGLMAMGRVRDRGKICGSNHEKTEWETQTTT